MNIDTNKVWDSFWEKVLKKWPRVVFILPISIICLFFTFQKLYNFKTSNPIIYKATLKAFQDTGIIIYNHLTGVTLTLLIFLTVFILLKISNKKFEQELDKDFKAPKFHKSSSTLPVETQIYESRDTVNEYKLRREITIFNRNKSKIDYIKGKILFYNCRRKIFEIPFEDSKIDVNRGTRICYDLVDDVTKKSWDMFYTYIEQLTINGQTDFDINLFGVHIHKTHFLILNRFEYFRIFGKRVLPFEISWLKELWLLEIWPRITYYFNYPKKYGNFSNIYRVYLFFRRRVSQLFVTSVIGGFLSIVILSFLSTIQSVYGIGGTWINLLKIIFGA